MKTFPTPSDSAANIRSRRRFALIAVLMTAILFALPAAINRVIRYREDRLADAGVQLMQSVYALDPASSPEDLIQQGYIDLDDLQASAQENVFLRQIGQVSSGQKAGLLSFTRAQEGLVIYALRPWTGGWLNVESYSLSRQTVINSSFPARLDRVQAADGVEEVWLRCAVWIEEVPMGPDILLYYRQTA